jgi:hypothetical protein
MEDIISLFLALIVALITALRSATRTMRVSWLRFCPQAEFLESIALDDSVWDE